MKAIMMLSMMVVSEDDSDEMGVKTFPDDGDDVG